MEWNFLTQDDLFRLDPEDTFPDEFDPEAVDLGLPEEWEEQDELDWEVAAAKVGYSHKN